MMKPIILIIYLGVIGLNLAYADSLDRELLADSSHYCQFVRDQNDAKKSALLSPEILLRAENSVNDYPYQNNLISALSKDITDLIRARFVTRLTDDECRYYRLHQIANFHIRFAVATIQNQALKFKLNKINHAKKILKQLLVRGQKRLAHQQETLINIYQLESSLLQLQQSAQEIVTTLAQAQLPEVKLVNIAVLLQAVKISEEQRQSTLNSLAKINNWSLQVQAGAQQNLSSPIHFHNQKVQPYGALVVRYNTAALLSNQYIDDSLQDYKQWKTQQIDGTQKKLARLATSVSELIEVETQRLQQLKTSYRSHQQLVKKISLIGSDNANRFKQKVDVDQLIAAIEINYLRYFIHGLNTLKV